MSDAELNRLIDQQQWLIQQARYSEAIGVGQRYCDLARRSFGEMSDWYAGGLNDLGHTYFLVGDYANAESLFRQALEITKRVKGEQSQFYLAGLSNLSAIYQAMGEYQKAEPLARNSLDIAGRVFGERHPDYALGLNNLAFLYQTMGDYRKAEPLYQKALEIERAVVGEEHPLYAQSLHNLASLYHSMGDYQRAEPLYRRALEIRRRVIGETHPDFAQSLNNLGLLYEAMGDYRKAEPLLRQAIDKWRKVLGEQHPNYAKGLQNLALLYQAMGEYQKAEPLYFQALEILRVALGEDHPDYAMSLVVTAALCEETGDFSKAEPLFLKAVEINRRALGEEHPNYAESLCGLAGLYLDMGDYGKAESLYHKSLEIQRLILGEEHPDYATTLNNLALLYARSGNYQKAEQLFRQAIDIRAKVLGEEHPHYSQSLGYLAMVYKDMGDYQEALPLLIQAGQIIEKTKGGQHPDLAQCLNNLGLLFLDLWDLPKAEQFFSQALEIWRAALGELHPLYGTGLNNLALVYLHMKDYPKAERLLREMIEITGKAVSEEHPRYALGLNNLAGLYSDMGDYAKAEPLYQQALEVVRKAVGEERPGYAQILYNLAALYRDSGDFQKAELLYRQAADIRRRTLTEEHPDYAKSLAELGLLLARSGAYPDALQLLKEELRIREKTIDNIFAVTSETQKLGYLGKYGAINYFLSLICGNFANDSNACADALTAVLRRKGIVLEALTSEHEAARLSTDPILMDQFNEITNIKREIVMLTLSGGDEQNHQRTQTRLAELTERLEAFEIAFSHRSKPFAHELKARRADATSVSSLLPGNSALIELVTFWEYCFKEGRWANQHYLAFVLRNGADSPALIDLGTSDELDPLIDTYRAEMDLENDRYNRRTPAEVEEQTAGPSRGIAIGGTRLEGGSSPVGFQAACRALYDRIFAPLNPYLEGVEQLFISPDGALNLVSFGSLLDPEDKFVIEQYHLTYLACGRDLLRHPSGKPQAPVAFADPDYDADRKTLKKTEQHLASEFASRAVNEGQNGWVRLGTASRREASIILSLFVEEGAANPKVYLGADANAETLAGVQAPRILHLSTHGFFWRDIEHPREEKLKKELTGVGRVMEHIGKLENPMHQSGLVLSGANRLFRDKDDTTGWVTAEEVSGLNLRGTELVVLSACSTGVGETRNGEGVMGLRRAFRMAGAKSLIMSLWKVPNEETKDLMVDFYTNFKTDGLAPAALRESTLEIINSARKKGSLAHPFYWAAFICEGGTEVAIETEDVIDEGEEILDRGADHDEKVAPSVLCASCSSPIKPGARFCAKCGKPVEIAHSTSGEASVRSACSSCGNSLKPGAGFCTKCGKPVEQTIILSSSDASQVICSHCGSSNKKGTRFCIRCGAPTTLT